MYRVYVYSSHNLKYSYFMLIHFHNKGKYKKKRASNEKRKCIIEDKGVTVSPCVYACVK